MTRSAALFGCVLALVASAACKNSSPLDPLITQATGATRILAVSGDLNFGTVPVGTTATREITLTNSGNAALTIQGLNTAGGTGPAGYSSTFAGATIAAGSSQTVALSFTPTLGQTYSTVITLVGNQTNGTSTVNVTGTGSVDHIPLFTRSGKGDTTFNLPTHISRVRITGHFVDTGGVSNFVVVWNQIILANVLLRTQDYDISFPLVGGGPIQIVNSPSIEWSFTEER